MWGIDSYCVLLMRQSHSDLKIKYKQPLQLFKNSYKQHSLVCHVSPVVHEAWHERLKWHQSRNFQHIKSLKCWSQGLQIHLAFLPWWLLGLRWWDNWSDGQTLIRDFSLAFANASLLFSYCKIVDGCYFSKGERVSFSALHTQDFATKYKAAWMEKFKLKRRNPVDHSIMYRRKWNKKKNWAMRLKYNNQNRCSFISWSIY